MKNKHTHSILGDDHIGRLLFRLSFPAMIGMFVQALYNAVDAMFVGQFVGSNALAGVFIVIPFHIVVLTVALMFGIGSASILSRSLGSGNIERAEKVTGNLFVLVIAASLVIMAIGYLGCDRLLSLFGANAEILPYSRQYMRIVLLGTVFFAFTVAGNHVVRAEGNAMFAMIAMLSGAILNIILDLIFIVLLEMGVRGAAIATVIAQVTTFTILVCYFLGGKSSVRFRISNIRLDRDITRETCVVGSPTLVRGIGGIIVFPVINNLLVHYGGSLSVAAYGCINRVVMLAAMPLFGLAQGLQPIIAFNYGAKRIGKLLNAIRLGMVVATIGMSVCFVVLFSMARLVISVFAKDDPALVEQGAVALRYVVLLLGTLGFRIVGSVMFQSIGKAVPALVISLSTQILFLIPAVLILPRMFGLTGVWLSFPISDGLSFLLTLVLVTRQMRKFRRDLRIQEEGVVWENV